MAGIKDVFKINRVVKLLMISDIFVYTGFGLIDPVIAIFFSEKIAGGSVFAAGLAVSLFMVTKSLVQLPFSKHVDENDDDDDLKWLIVGTLIVVLIPFLYMSASHIYMIYGIQILYGIGAGLSFPAWLGLWSTHLDKKRESFEWSLYSTLLGIGTAGAATAGAAIAQYFGFNASFMFAGIMSLLGCLIIMDLKLKNGKNKSSIGGLLEAYGKFILRSIPAIVLVSISLGGLAAIMGLLA